MVYSHKMARGESIGTGAAGSIDRDVAVRICDLCVESVRVVKRGVVRVDVRASWVGLSVRPAIEV